MAHRQAGCLCNRTARSWWPIVGCSGFCLTASLTPALEAGAQRGPLVIRPLGWRFFLMERSWWLRPFREPAALSLNMTRMAVSTPPSELAANWPALELQPVWGFSEPGIFLPAEV